MAFPQTPLNTKVELALGADLTADPATWTWTDITDQVLHRDRIQITRGRANEQSQLEPSRATLTLKNTGGQFVPRNPNSPYYGLLHKNTPLRISVDPVGIRDMFNRTVVDDWGTADSGETWTRVGGAASDYSVSEGLGRHSVTNVNNSRYSILPVDLVDFDFTASVATDALAVGGSHFAQLVGRFTDPDNTYLARLEFTTSQVVNLTIRKRVSGSETLLGSTFNTGLAHASGRRFKARFQGLGSTLRAKVWLATDPEPQAWSLSVTDTDLTAPGGVGLRSILSVNNTNPLPVLFTYDDVQTNGNIRFEGYVSEWPPRWDVSGNDKYVQIEASGITRRLTQGAAPLKSALYRAHQRTDPLPTAYWPLEDDRDTQQAASGVLGGVPLAITGRPAFGSDQHPAGALSSVAFTNADALRGIVPSGVNNTWTVSFWIRGEPGSTVTLPIRWRTPRSGLWRKYELNASMQFNVLELVGDDESGAQSLLMSAPVTFSDGRWRHVLITANQVAGISYTMRIDNVVVDTATEASDTATEITAIEIGNGQTGTDVSGQVSHLAVWNVPTAQFTVYLPIFKAGNGYADEAASDRGTRLANEEDVPFSVVPGPSEPMGPQAVGSIVDLLKDCEAADGGLLYETTDGRLGYVPRSARYNSPVGLVLDYAAGHISPPLEPVDDDQNVTNDVTVERVGGSRAQVTDTNHVAENGRYDSSATINVSSDLVLPSHAGWRVHLGTHDELRYPRVNLNLAAHPELIDDWLSADVGTRVKVDNPPVDLPPDPIDVFIEGYTETLGLYEWFVECNCSPAKPWDVLKLDDPVLGRLDTDGSQLNSSINATTTTLSVAVTAGPTWTTNAADRPFDIMVGGERMTVTNVTGTSSPQTFTVIRSVNGVVKSHPAGTEVHVADPVVLAL